MIAERNVTCIVCPIGCKILVKTDETKLEIVGGNKCERGIEYARNETLDPRRMLTTSVLVNEGELPLVSVKSTKPIPKEKLFTAVIVFLSNRSTIWQHIPILYIKFNKFRVNKYCSI